MLNLLGCLEKALVTIVLAYYSSVYRDPIHPSNQVTPIMYHIIPLTHLNNMHCRRVDQ